MSLNQCYDITDDALAGIDSEIGKRLNEAEFTGCGKLHHSISRMVRLCPHLLKLNLRGVPLICDKTIIALATSCSQLEHLDLSVQTIRSSTSTKSYTPKVGSEGIKALGNNCPRLRILRVNGCTRLDDECIITVAKGCTSLEELALKHCYRITDSALKIIGENCPSMTRIFLSSCKYISDGGIKRLSQGCHMLEVVDLMGVVQITDNSVIHMAMNCSNLKRLNLRDCYRLSDKSLRGLTELCSYLEDIDMYAVDHLSDHSIDELHSCCPFIRSLNVGGSEISDVMLKKLNKILFCSTKTNNKLALKPLHKQLEVHVQHVKVRFISSSHYKNYD